MKAIILLLSLAAASGSLLDQRGHVAFVQNSLASAGGRACSTRLALTRAPSPLQASPREGFEYWIGLMKKAYADAKEYEHRFQVWMDNLKYVAEYNARHTSHFLGMNTFADLTHDEYRARALGYRADLAAGRKQRLGTAPFLYANTTPAKEVDWRAKGAVSEVKNQLLCGSCWAFSTTGAVEGVSAIVAGQLHSLSEQMLIDCDTTRDHGCHGGLMDFAFEYIIANGGIDTEKDYPYTAQEGTCQVNKVKRHVVTIDDYQDLPPNDEHALAQAVTHQPVAVAIEADQRAFQLYVGGVFDAECGTQLDHGVLVVGYGTAKNGSHDVAYWLVKNSWGAEWGDHGYIRLQRGLGGQGQCGIAMQASFPIKKGPNPPEPPPAPPTPTPPPTPQPVACDDTTQCPAGNTCCCMRDFFGFCFTWACCPLENAVCCDDHEHCCPSDLPVCDTVAGRCLKGPGQGFEGSVPMSKKAAAESRTRQGWGPFRHW
eukprot:scaffold8.g1556.t1